MSGGISTGASRRLGPSEIVPGERLSRVGLPLKVIAAVTCNRLRAQACQTDVLIGRQAADGNSAHHVAVLPNWNAATPPNKLGVAIIGNIMPLLGMPDFLSN